MKALLATISVVLAVTASATAADFPPTAYGGATLGTERVFSGVVLDDKSVDMRGVWIDESRPCKEVRRVRVHVVIHIGSRRIQRKGTFANPNCSEGGPNVGFTLSARSLKLACPDGTWKPGDYSFATTTTDLTSKLEALASVTWDKPGSC